MSRREKLFHQEKEMGRPFYLVQDAKNHHRHSLSSQPIIRAGKNLNNDTQQKGKYSSNRGVILRQLGALVLSNCYYNLLHNLMLTIEGTSGSRCEDNLFRQYLAGLEHKSLIE